MINYLPSLPQLNCLTDVKMNKITEVFHEKTTKCLNINERKVRTKKMCYKKSQQKDQASTNQTLPVQVIKQNLRGKLVYIEQKYNTMKMKLDGQVKMLNLLLNNRIKENRQIKLCLVQLQKQLVQLDKDTSFMLQQVQNKRNSTSKPKSQTSLRNNKPNKQANKDQLNIQNRQRQTTHFQNLKQKQSNQQYLLNIHKYLLSEQNRLNNQKLKNSRSSIKFKEPKKEELKQKKNK